MTLTSETDVLPLLDKIIAANSPVSLAILVFTLAAWIIGGNILISYHLRRVGKKQSNIFSFPFKNFNRAEWTIFLGLLFVSFFLIFVALLVNGK